MDKFEEPKYVSGKSVTMRALIENTLRLKPREIVIENTLELDLKPVYEYKTTCDKISKNKKRFIRKKHENKILVIDEAHLLFHDMLGDK